MTNGIEKNTHTLVPAVDIVETKSSYIVKMDVPGAVKDKIKAQIQDNSLHVSASIADYGESGKESEPVREYRREFSLASDIDVNTIDAQFDLGVLTITLNKKLQYLPKEITIN